MPTSPLPVAPVPCLAPALVEMMAALARAGFSLLPLGGGPDGKAPLCRFDGRRLPLKQVLGAMGAKGSSMYGVRLKGLVVLDCDVDDAALVETLEARFGPAAVQVRTSCGRHLWYHAPEGALLNLRGEGLPVDVKSGPNAYVAGPGSVRPDGQTYVLAKGDLATDALTVPGLAPQATAGCRLGAAPWASEFSKFSGTASVPSPASPPSLEIVEGGRVPEGQRHHTLTREAVRAARSAPSLEDLTDQLRLVVARDFANPSTFPDAEIANLAAWAWRKRLENNLWGAESSTFAMSRQVRAALKGKPYSIEAWWLLSVLVEAHGHVPGKRFMLDREAMNTAGLGLSQRGFAGAKRLLEAVGVLQRAKGHSAGRSRAQWQLGRPPR